jgi:choline dehydrogenase
VNETFDYVVVGGGSAGCVVAGKLAEQSGVRVLLLEAGPAAEEHPETLSADGYKYAFANDSVMWERFSVPQPHCGNQRVFVGSGTVLGGSGSVNGMVYTRGAKEDYAEWPVGWKWNDVASDFAGIEERLRVRRRPPTRWTEACISAAVACGFERRDDLNDGHLSNVVGYEWMSYEGDRRRSSYVAFVKDAGARPNLHVRSKARVRRIVFDDARRASAVEYEIDGQRMRAVVRREVVMCAGALETPKLLMLSGVGPGQALRSNGLDVVHDLPAMGQNLHDHPNVPLFFVSRGHVDCHWPQLYSFYRTRASAELAPKQSDTCYVFWPAPSAMKQAMQRMLPGKVLPEGLYGPLKPLVRGGLDLAFAPRFVNQMVDHLYGIVVILGKPQSRGSVRLSSPDPTKPALVDPAYFSASGDMQTMVEGVRLARKLSKSGGLGAWRSKELMPGPWNQSDDALARFVEKNAITTYHFAGTCAMGEGSRSVCDARLRLRGVQGVRIADASAVPVTPVSAMNAPSMLVAWRAARWLLEDAPS